MSKTKTISDNIVPAAAPAEDEIMRWRCLPHDERIKRFQRAVRDGFESGLSKRSIDEIIHDAHSRMTDRKDG